MVKKVKPFHKQVSVKLTDGREIACDEKMASLIYELNEVGLITIFSCQGGRMPGLLDPEGKEKKRYDFKAQVIINLRSISSVNVDANYLKIEWVMKNPKKNFKGLKHLTQMRNKFLKQYSYGDGV